MFVLFCCCSFFVLFLFCFFVVVVVVFFCFCFFFFFFFVLFVFCEIIIFIIAFIQKSTCLAFSVSLGKITVYVVVFTFSILGLQCISDNITGRD